MSAFWYGYIKRRAKKIPISKSKDDLTQKILKVLDEYIIGQDHAKSTISCSL